ncbi:GNAT family N-acetyltransferase [Arenibaculum pallidiluteum]|uniref:GNAT family N-acetyltransferase n=1 Tax=Arenibaculum pallidiluteum TaxID=2812559 RepID=UPI001A969F8E|nr:GNAT family N-acetyltransferase [Arenibaculum pallidiluteum]
MIAPGTIKGRAMQPMACRIRPAKRYEIPEIEQCCVEANLQYGRDVSPDLFDPFIKGMENLNHYWNDTQVLVAETSGRIVGSIQYCRDASTEGLGWPPHWAGFRKLAVRPSARGHAIGRMLIEGCLALAAEDGASAIGVHASFFMAAARHTYEKMGFQRCPEYDVRASVMSGRNANSADFIIFAYGKEIRARL